MKPFALIVADPPWEFGDSLPGPKRGASSHYPCMGIDDICAFPLPPIADDAWLLVWRVASMVPEAYRVCEAWGFEAKAEIVWVKTGVKNIPGQPAHGRMGMGRSVRNAHEVAIVAKRGRPTRLNADVPSVFHAPRGRHSAKPDLFFELAERLGPGPRLELFARRRRAGWTCMGNEIQNETQG